MAKKVKTVTGETAEPNTSFKNEATEVCQKRIRRETLVFDDRLDLMTTSGKVFSVCGRRFGLLGVHQNYDSDFTVSHLPTGTLIKTFVDIDIALDLVERILSEFTEQDLNFVNGETASQDVIERLYALILSCPP